MPASRPGNGINLDDEAKGIVKEEEKRKRAGILFLPLNFEENIAPN
jgi:hypothetical protein